MIEIIPTIIAKDFVELKKQIEQVEHYVNWIQLDIMDGKFVPNETWPYFAEATKGEHSPSDLKNIDTPASLEAHLMIEEPERVLDDWLEVVGRIIVHLEATQKIDEIIAKIHTFGKQVGVALNPETSLEAIKPHLNQLDLVLCMTVSPGFGGQKFKDEVLTKIRALRRIHPEINIQVDGGIKPGTAKKAVEAGANLLACGSFIYQSKSISGAIKELRKDVGINN